MYTAFIVFSASLQVIDMLVIWLSDFQANIEFVNSDLIVFIYQFIFLYFIFIFYVGNVKNKKISELKLWEEGLKSG